MIDNLFAVHAFPMHILTLLSVDEMLSRYVNWSTNFRGLSLKAEMAPCLKCMTSILFAFMLRAMPPVKEK